MEQLALGSARSLTISAICNPSTIQVVSKQGKDQSVLLATTKTKKQNKPASLLNKSLMKKEFHRMAKVVSNQWKMSALVYDVYSYVSTWKIHWSGRQQWSSSVSYWYITKTAEVETIVGCGPVWNDKKKNTTGFGIHKRDLAVFSCSMGYWDCLFSLSLKFPGGLLLPVRYKGVWSLDRVYATFVRFQRQLRADYTADDAKKLV
ncbi:hypothetical protein CASFOL_034128 [Castilleja foliolosa]|uniref:Uncharacterized protein n=1 Tax=Castilleja foliolosa TaxID=1961234 RepID=A0ABD3BZ78_9LAMI